MTRDLRKNAESIFLGKIVTFIPNKYLSSLRIDPCESGSAHCGDKRKMGITVANPGRSVPISQFAAKDWDLGGEHPGVVLRDVASRPRPNGHVIVFANEKGGVGKSTIAFHTAIALCDAGRKVAVIDLDHGQATLSGALTNREATCRLLKVGLPSPRHVAFSQTSAAVLSQEIARIGSDCTYVLIDVAGGDSPIARRAIAMADTLVTPVSSSFADIDLLGQFDAINMRLKRLGRFSRLVEGLRQARQSLRLPDIDWLVVPNRSRRSGSNNEAIIDGALCQLSAEAGFRIAQGLGERVAYRELFLYGLTHFDLKRIPNLGRVKANARDEISQLIADLQLPADDDEQADLFADEMDGRAQPLAMPA
jgi:chromosome partitioning protein